MKSENVTAASTPNNSPQPNLPIPGDAQRLPEPRKLPTTPARAGAERGKVLTGGSIMLLLGLIGVAILFVVKDKLNQPGPELFCTRPSTAS